MSCRRRSCLAICLAVAGGLAGCGEPPETIAAVVGEVEIGAGEVERFAASLDEALRSKESGEAARREYVETLVGEELLVMEGRSRGLDREPGFEADLERRFRQKVVSNYHRDRLGPAVQVSEAEIREEFVRRGYNSLKELSRIVVATLEEARALHRKLQQGSALRLSGAGAFPRQEHGPAGRVARKDHLAGSGAGRHPAVPLHRPGAGGTVLSRRAGRGLPAGPVLLGGGRGSHPLSRPTSRRAGAREVHPCPQRPCRVAQGWPSTFSRNPAPSTC